MTPDEYLRNVLDSQNFKNDDEELARLRERIATVKDRLRQAFESSRPSLRQAGSLAKDTMIKDSYDGDVTCYFPHEDSEPGTSLRSIYETVRGVLEQHYFVESKPSALRIKDRTPESYGMDFHIDVVPGRYVDDDETDVHLHHNGPEKAYLKTNLHVHIDHVKKSGVRSAIRLGKLWNVRHGVGAKTFVLELLIIKLLVENKSACLSEQLIHVWTELRDKAGSLTVEDPANPCGNDLRDAVDACRWALSSVAASTLAQIETTGWESVFGPVVGDGDGPEGGGGQKTAALKSAAAAVTTRTRPWCQ